MASSKHLTFQIKKDERKMPLLNFLRSHKLPIAFSCDGQGICKKCLVNENILSCQISLEEFLKKHAVVEVGYL